MLSLVTVACQSVPLLAPGGSTITLTSTSTALPLSGTTDLIAQVVQASGTAPQSGTHVIFTTTLGSIQPADATTDTTGRVVVKFNAGTASGTATITASSGGANVGANGAVKIAVGAAAVGKVAIAANPSTVPAVGGTSTITATILDVNGNALANLPVTFTTTAGALNPGVAYTDQNGNAATTLTTSKTAIVTATAGIQGSTSGGGTGSTTPSNQVTVNVNQVSTVTVGSPSPASPFVGQSVTFSLTYAANQNGSPIQKVVMDFGDGTAPQTLPGTPTSASHPYTAVGSYAVRATAFDTLGDFTTGSNSVTVVDRPRPTISITPSANPTAGTPVTFTVTVTPPAGTAIQDVTISYGDDKGDNLGPVSGTFPVQHVYDVGKTYTVTVNARDSGGGTSQGAAIIVVTDLAPLSVNISFTKTPSSPPPTTVVNFTATVIPPSAVIAQYEWDFDDGPKQVTTGNQASHTYTIMRTYVVKVTVTTTRGATAVGTTTVVIP